MIAVPSQGAGHFRCIVLRNAEHLLYGERRENAVAVPAAAVQQAGTQNCQVLHIGEYAGIAGIPAIAEPGRRVMDFGLEDKTVFQNLGRGAKLHQAGPIRGPFIERKVSGMAESKDIENMLLGIVAEPFTRHLLQYIL